LEEAKSIKCPMFIIFGSEDDYQSNPAEKLDILKNNIKCDLKLIEGGNHWFADHEKEMSESVINWVENNFKARH
jgi:dipeptidyl aminopeptidase/acylaminoacyl peptidase